ncbi:DM13 domain-containing protein [Plantactinospora sp. WMMB782]|uniref:DM13 domain-containing protein n=1 Tax=Plantactinospora sp. WMMB782 TaxID=3404121 RepID=UPI003B9379C3
MFRRLLRAPLTWVVAAVLVAAAIFGGYWFQPWKLVVDQNVAERLTEPAPEAPTTGPPSTGPSTVAPSTAPSSPAAGAAARPVLVSRGTFVTHEHETSGTARIVRQPDGGHRLELVDLDTSNGPDLRVWLSDQPVRAGRAGWHVFDDGRFVELGRLKGNRGDQAYAVPAGTDLERLRSVSIWCRRFAVSFGAAELGPVR